MWHIGVHKVNKSDIYLNNCMKYFILIHCLRHYGYFFFLFVKTYRPPVETVLTIYAT